MSIYRSDLEVGSLCLAFTNVVIEFLARSSIVRPEEERRCIDSDVSMRNKMHGILGGGEGSGGFDYKINEGSVEVFFVVSVDCG
jgi:hypothetical protein